MGIANILLKFFERVIVYMFLGGLLVGGFLGFACAALARAASLNSELKESN